MEYQLIFYTRNMDRLQIWTRFRLPRVRTPVQHLALSEIIYQPTKKGFQPLSLIQLYSQVGFSTDLVRFFGIPGEYSGRQTSIIYFKTEAYIIIFKIHYSNEIYCTSDRHKSYYNILEIADIVNVLCEIRRTLKEFVFYRSIDSPG